MTNSDCTKYIFKLEHCKENGGNIYYNGYFPKEWVSNGITYKGTNYEDGLTLYHLTKEGYDFLIGQGYFDFKWDKEIAKKKKYDGGISQYQWLGGHGEMVGTRYDYIHHMFVKMGIKQKLTFKKGDIRQDENFIKSIEFVNNSFFIKVTYFGGCIMKTTTLSDSVLIEIGRFLMTHIQMNWKEF